jgi:hypothetical protein
VTVERIASFYRGKFQSRVMNPPERLIFWRLRVISRRVAVDGFDWRRMRRVG